MRLGSHRRPHLRRRLRSVNPSDPSAPCRPRPEMGAAFFLARADPRARGARTGEFSLNSKPADETACVSGTPAPPEPAADMPSMRARHFLHRLGVSLCVLAMASFALPAEARELSAQEAVAKVQQET